MPTSPNAVRILSVCFIGAFQKAAKLAVIPDPNRPTPQDRLEFLSQEVLRDIKNLPAYGASEQEEVAAKSAAIQFVEATVAYLRRSID
jgi:hypothetical protein